MTNEALEQLQVSIEAAVRGPRGMGRWAIDWVVRNETLRPLAIWTIRVPHDQFHAENWTTDDSAEIPGGEERSFLLEVSFNEPARSTLTYPFIILQATWNGIPCRLFGRLRVETDAAGIPRPICEEVTVRPAQLPR